MTVLTKILAAGSFISLAQSAPFRNGPVQDAYNVYHGTAEAPSWPNMDLWVSSYDSIFNANRRVIQQSCGAWNVPNNSGQETNDVYDSIKQVSAETGVDPRFIFAIMMQESNGCVRVPTTNWGVRNPGLMQDHNGAATCNEGGIRNPCPKQTIYQMIRDGVAGTSSGDGLVQLLGKAGGNGHSRFYKAARMYNSGSLDPSGELEKGIATHCYVSDVANRLTGWVYAQKACSLDGASAPASVPPAAGDPFGIELPLGGVVAPPSLPWTPATPPGVPAPPALPAPAPAPTTESSPYDVQENSLIKSKASKLAPGVTTDCSGYYRVRDGDFCFKVAEKTGISFAQLRQWNNQVDAACSNLWLGYDYCVRRM